MRLFAHAENHKSCEYVPKSTTMIINCHTPVLYQNG